MVSGSRVPSLLTIAVLGETPSVVVFHLAELGDVNLTCGVGKLVGAKVLSRGGYRQKDFIAMEASPRSSLDLHPLRTSVGGCLVEAHKVVGAGCAGGDSTPNEVGEEYAKEKKRREGKEELVREWGHLEPPGE